MSATRVFVLCPDYDEPSGGVRRLYRHVDVLRRQGFDACLLHEQPGFRCSWFKNDTPVRAVSETQITARDFVVVPEIYGPQLGRLAPGAPKVVFNQNAYLTFQGFPTTNQSADPYRGADVVTVFAVSEDNAEYLRFAFPGLPVRRLHYGIDPLFAPRWPKKKSIAYMPRKNAGDATQVLHLLHCRDSLWGWEVVPISGRPEAAVAALLAECAVFLSFGTVEGCPLPPLEAMASGCVVVGYDGRGGREYFDPSFSRPVEAGDIVGFARAVEDVLLADRRWPGSLEQWGRTAESFVRKTYSPQREEEDIVAAWRGILERRQRPGS